MSFTKAFAERFEHGPGLSIVGAGGETVGGDFAGSGPRSALASALAQAKNGGRGTHETALENPKKGVRKQQ